MDLKDELLHLLLWINNQTQSTGLYSVPKQSIPINLLVGKIYIERAGYVHMQMEQLNKIPTLRSWNLNAHTLLICSIIEPPTNEQILVLDTIANYLNVTVDYMTMTVRRNVA